MPTPDAPPPDDGTTVDWRRLIPDYDTLCAVALNVAVAAGRGGSSLTAEVAARWWIDLYRAGRQEPFLRQAEQALLRREKSDPGIAVEIPTGDDTVLCARLTGPTYGGVAAVINLDRMIRRLFARANQHRRQGIDAQNRDPDPVQGALVSDPPFGDPPLGDPNLTVEPGSGRPRPEPKPLPPRAEYLRQVIIKMRADGRDMVAGLSQTKRAGRYATTLSTAGRALRWLNEDGWDRDPP